MMSKHFVWCWTEVIPTSWQLCSQSTCRRDEGGRRTNDDELRSFLGRSTNAITNEKAKDLSWLHGESSGAHLTPMAKAKPKEQKWMQQETSGCDIQANWTIRRSLGIGQPNPTHAKIRHSG